VSNEPVRISTVRDAIVFIQSLDRPDLEKLRNELEIQIYHAESHLGFLAKYSWFVCAVAAGLALLNKDVLALIVAIVVAGLAYTMRSIESRRAAFLLALVGALTAADVPYRLMAAQQPHEVSIGFVISIVFLGFSAAKTIFRLKNLRAFRALIPLPPAPHLQDPA
jgi:hypothetical protein